MYSKNLLFLLSLILSISISSAEFNLNFGEILNKYTGIDSNYANEVLKQVENNLEVATEFTYEKMKDIATVGVALGNNAYEEIKKEGLSSDEFFSSSLSIMSNIKEQMTEISIHSLLQPFSFLPLYR